jgi:hypothetical protein
VGGVTFDPTTDKLYVLITGAWTTPDGSEYFPEVWAYKVS